MSLAAARALTTVRSHCILLRSDACEALILATSGRKSSSVALPTVVAPAPSSTIRAPGFVRLGRLLAARWAKTGFTTGVVHLHAPFSIALFCRFGFFGHRPF